MEFEIVLYKFGSSMYHRIGDDATLRPDVEEKLRIPFNFHGGSRRYVQQAHYLYAKNGENCNPVSPIFSSFDKLEEWRKKNNLKYVTDVYREVSLKK